jgi:hypothetical protein
MSDEWKSFVSIGQAFAAHDTVRHSDREYARGFVHANSVESFNDRVRRTIAGVFHHISRRHADLYFNEVGFRWSQRVKAGNAVRRTRKDARSSNLCGLGSRPHSNCRLYSSQRSDVNCVAPRQVESRSGALLLSLGDKADVVYLIPAGLFGDRFCPGARGERSDAFG